MLRSGKFVVSLAKTSRDNFQFSRNQMEIIRKTDILVKTKRRFIISQPETCEQIFCSFCPGQMISAEASAVLFKLSRRAVYRMIETERIHFTESENGLLFICPDSFAEILTHDAEKEIRL